MNILDEAKIIIDGDREKTYGAPDANINRIAMGWSMVLGIPITADQVCLCMTVVKIARLVHTPDHRDSQVDGCGYLALMEKIQNHKKENS